MKTEPRPLKDLIAEGCDIWWEWNDVSNDWLIRDNDCGSYHFAMQGPDKSYGETPAIPIIKPEKWR